MNKKGSLLDIPIKSTVDGKEKNQGNGIIKRGISTYEWENKELLSRQAVLALSLGPIKSTVNRHQIE